MRVGVGAGLVERAGEHPHPQLARRRRRRTPRTRRRAARAWACRRRGRGSRCTRAARRGRRPARPPGPAASRAARGWRRGRPARSAGRPRPACGSRPTSPRGRPARRPARCRRERRAGTIVGLTFSSTTSRVISTRAASGLLGTSYITESRTSSMIARRPRAPVPRRIAWSAIASRAAASNSSSTPSSSNSRWYCRTSALRGSVRILTSASRSRLRTLVMTGSRPMNSGIRPNFSMSSGMTWPKTSSVERSETDRRWAPKPRPFLPDPLLDDLVEAGERAAADEQHVGGVDLDELLVRVLATALRRHVGDRALEDLQQRLLHALAGDVPGDRRVLATCGRSCRPRRCRRCRSRRA